MCTQLNLFRTWRRLGEGTPTTVTESLSFWFPPAHVSTRSTTATVLWGTFGVTWGEQWTLPTESSGCRNGWELEIIVQNYFWFSFVNTKERSLSSGKHLLLQCSDVITCNGVWVLSAVRESDTPTSRRRHTTGAGSATVYFTTLPPPRSPCEDGWGHTRWSSRRYSGLSPVSEGERLSLEYSITVPVKILLFEFVLQCRIRDYTCRGIWTWSVHT